MQNEQISNRQQSGYCNNCEPEDHYSNICSFEKTPEMAESKQIETNAQVHRIHTLKTTATRGNIVEMVLDPQEQFPEVTNMENETRKGSM